MSSNKEKRDALLVPFEQLPKTERSIVQLCSILVESVHHAKIHQCLQELGIKRADGKAFTSKILLSTLDHLKKQKLLKKTSLSAQYFLCNESIAWAVTRSAVEDGCFKAMVAAVQKFMPAVDSYYASYATSVGFDRCIREIRMGIFGHSVAQVDEYLKIVHKHFSEQWVVHRPLVRLCLTPFDVDWFRTLPMAIQVLALEELTFFLLEGLEDLAEVCALLQEYRHLPEEGHGHRFRSLLVTIFMIQGAFSEAEAILDASAVVADHLVLQGWLLFFRGQNDQAIQTYELALKALKKSSGERKTYFTHLGGLFFLFALLKTNDPTQYRRISEFLVIIRRKKILTAAPAYHCFGALMLAQENHVAPALTLLGGSEAKMTRIGLLFQTMVRFWIELDEARKHMFGLKALFIRARDRNYRWVALELAKLLPLLGVESTIYGEYAAEVEEKYGLQSILPILAREERWARTLKALTLLTADKNSAKIRGTSANNRLVWLIQVVDTCVEIHPKEQTMMRGGCWSKGRAVGLKRLSEQAVELQFLTDQDLRIVQAIAQEDAPYGRTRFEFRWERAMLAMVGHPLVFWEDAPNVNVEVVRVEPELLVQKERRRLHIKFSDLFGDQSVIASKESPTRCQLVEITAAHKAIAGVLGQAGLSVPLEGKERVLEAMQALTPLVTIQSAIGGGQEAVDTLPADSKPHVQLLPFGEGLKLKILVRPFADDGPYFIPGKGGKTIIAEVRGKRVQTHRNLRNERTRALAVISACPSLAGFEEILQEWTFEEPEACLELLLELQESGEEPCVEWPEGEKFQVSRPISMEHLQVQVQRDKDWFEFHGSVRLDESLVLEMDRLLDLLQNSPGRFVSLGDDKFLALTDRFRKQLLEISAFSEKSGKGQRFHPLAAPIFQDITEKAQSLEVDKHWKAHLKRMRDAQNLQVEVPSTLQVVLRDYQEAGFHWLSRLAAWGVGACLADDMGLGKTLQALALILSRAAKGPVLVVAPTSVCFNWLKEINRFAPTLNAVFFTGTRRQQLLDECKAFDVLVCSYGLLQQEEAMLTAVDWNVIVLDEAQAIKNRGTKRSKAAMALKSSFKMLLTGTPIENHLGEFWNLFHFINPGLLGSLEVFNERFAVPIERHAAKDVRQRLKKLIQPFVLRRTKSQVLEELPSRTEITLHVEMSTEETAFYETLRRRALAQIDNLQGPVEQKQFQIFAEIMRLRRACCNSRLIMPESPIASTKLELFWRVVKDLLDNQHKALVFSQFVDHLSIIRERLDREKVAYQYLDGRTSAKERQRRVDAFQAGEGDLFLISLRAGGMGINLTAADYVIHMDPWWNPAVEDQASDRAHRIGQRRPVTIYRLVTRGTIEEMIVDLHQHKRNLADGLLEGSDMSGRLTAEDLLQIIRGQV